jgi:hypothetical protein
MWAFIREYGIWMYLYYWITNEILVCILTYLLHYHYIPGGDVVKLLKWLGAERFVDLDKTMEKSMFIGGFELSAKFLTNFSLASAVMSLFTPIQFPLAVATFPAVRRGWRSLRGLGNAPPAAAEQYVKRTVVAPKSS